MKTGTISKLLASMAVIALSSCVSKVDKEITIDPNLIRINAIHPSAHQTKVTSTGFEVNDEIGVFVVGKGITLQAIGNSVNNGKYTYDGVDWKANRPYYWSTGLYDVYSYYPFQNDVSDVENLYFAVQEDQSIADGYSKSDFLWARSEGQRAGDSAVSLIFNHVLSRVLVILEKGASYEGEIPNDAEVYLHNVVPVASIDLSTGSSCKDNSAGTSVIKMLRLERGKYAAIVVPQMLSTRRPIVEITSGTISYLVEGTISFKQGFQHTLKVTLAANPQQSEIEIGGGIQDWN